MGVLGYIMQMQPFSVNDGEGIRTTIFMAGCPLRCKWCSNPEGFSQREIIGWYQRKCIGCGDCVRVCPQGIGINMNIERDRCISCGKCTEVCSQNARTRMVTYMDADDILSDIHKHRLFYAYSGGGITFSGGEATSQPELLDYLTSEIYDMGYSMDIETSGYFDYESVRPSLERMDLIFMDLKHMDPEKHRYYTGVPNDRILENIKNLGTLRSIDRPGHGPDIVIRIPVICGVNDSEDNIRQSAAYVHKVLPEARMELLPYHSFGMIKYEALGIPYDHPECSAPDKERMDHLKDVIMSEGILIADYR